MISNSSDFKHIYIWIYMYANIWVFGGENVTINDMRNCACAKFQLLTPGPDTQNYHTSDMLHQLFVIFLDLLHLL